jgi:hypothetical protein
MLEAFARLLDSGRTTAEVTRVLCAYMDRSTSAATFARDGSGNGQAGGPGLAWALRPGDKGGFDRILLQLDAEQIVDARPHEPLIGMNAAAGKRLIARMEEFRGKH